MKKTKLSIKVAVVTILFGLGLVSCIYFYARSFWSHQVTIEAEKSLENQENHPSSTQVENSAIRKQLSSEYGAIDISQNTNSGTDTLKNDKNLSGKGGSDNKLDIVSRLVNFGFEARNSRNIDTIIIHSSYDAEGSDPFNVGGVIREYKDYGVSPHYLIDRGGIVYQLVIDNNIAYHAGAGKVPDGRSGVNEFSIGIELLNTKTGKFTDNQYDSLNKLLDLLKSKYRIKYALGHNQIAPGRKDDPWNFDWSRVK